MRARDPVCGREVVVGRRTLRHEYAGAAYYFHAQECLDRFTQDADIFTTGQPEGELVSRDRGRRSPRDEVSEIPRGGRAVAEQPPVDAGPG
jgi:YHS domain-containing protein